MTTIVNLPDEPKFTIKAVSTQTGIRPVTLRAWERRHEVLNPHRADNHYRLYSERDIAILRWLKYRVDEGMSISSAVSELRSMTSNSIWPEAIPLIPTPIPGGSDIPAEHYTRRLSAALIRHDENRAGDLLREVHARFDLLSVFMDVISPALRQIRDACYRDEIRPATEHFAIAYLRGKLLTLLQAYPSRRSAPLVLIGCAPMELNEMDSLMLAVLLRSEGCRVEYLGPDIPVEDLADYSTYELPALVILSAGSEFTARETRRMQAMLKKVRSAPIFAYMGQAFEQQPRLRDEIPGVYLGSNLEINLHNIKALIKSRQKSANKAVKIQ